MPTEIYLVKAGMTMSEGIVEEWYVPDGGTVKLGDPLYRLETEKINLDVEAEASGTVKHLVAVGVTRAPGDVIGYIYAPGESMDVAPSAEKAAGPAPARNIETQSQGSPPAPNPTAQAGDRRPSSPAARRLARELGIELGDIEGTGPGGRIVESDVQRAHAAKARPASAPPPQASAPAVASRTIPVRGMRRTIARRMHESLTASAQLTMDMIVRMEDAARLREQLIAEWQAKGVRPSFTDLVTRAVAKSLPAHPHMNSRFEGEQIVLLGEIHIGIAVALDEGLVVPVLRNAQRLDLEALARESARLADLARSHALSVDDVTGGTFTVSALGMFGVDSFTPILNAPETGILGVNRIYDGVEWEGDVPRRRRMMRLSLTWDHRVLDGAPAARFLADVKALLEAPYRLLV